MTHDELGATFLGAALGTLFGVIAYGGLLEANRYNALMAETEVAIEDAAAWKQMAHDEAARFDELAGYYKELEDSCSSIHATGPSM